MIKRLTGAVLGAILMLSAVIASSQTVSGELKKWHKVTIDFAGPNTSETNGTNPFLNYRLDVTFTNGSNTYVVPGYFAADGNAANTGAASGNVWRVHFSPDATGTWTYTASFRKGTNVAVADNPSGFATDASIHGKNGSFTIGDTDKTGRDLRGKGHLRYVGEHHLRFDNGEWFIKAGPDSPENLLAYYDIDNTGGNTGLMKNWAPHVQDWSNGDPTWGNSKGKGLIGAINYLASRGVNSISFLTMNVNGDDKNVNPWITKDKRTQYDCSKLDQWEIIFEHAEKKGMYLHFKTQETENEMLLDNGDLGNTRKLYYRELIARYSHHNALNWNIGEENGEYGSTNQNAAQQRACIKYFRDNDPYGSNVVLHTAPGLTKQKAEYNNLLGSLSVMTGVSIQTNWNQVYNDTKHWVTESAAAGRKWVVANDEQGNAQLGVPHDDYTGTPDLHDIREQVLWGNYMAGGAGVEYYFGYGANVPNVGHVDMIYDHSDMRCEDFRTRDKSWRYVDIALKFFNEYVPFWQMTADNSKTTSGQCLYLANKSYLIYLPNGGNPKVNLGSGTYNVRWFNPRTGGSLTNGNSNISGNVNIGSSPTTGSDWVALVENTTYNHVPNGQGGSSELVTDIDLSTNTLSLTVGQSDQISANVYPASAINKAINWSSSNPSVATVSSNGTVTAIASGFASITAKSTDGTNVTSSCNVTVAADCQNADAFEEKDGYVVIEMEDAITLSSEWSIHTGTGALGSGYIQYNGNDRFGGAQESGTIRYKVKINNPGTYQFKWRTRRAANAVSGDAANDTWLKILGDDFYGMKGGTKVDCKDHFMKIWIQKDDFLWDMYGEHAGTNSMQVFAEFDTQGEYIIEVSGRSKGHVIDRMALYKSNKASIAMANSTVAATASCDEVDPCTTILSKDFSKYANISGYNNATLAAIPNSPANSANVGEVVLGCGGTNGLNTPCAAEQTYNGPAGNAIFTLNAMAEPDGECTYEVFVNGVKIGEKQTTRIHGTSTPAYTVEPLQINTTGVAINTGDVIRVTFNQTSNNLVAEGSGYATARGRWRSIEVCTSGGSNITKVSSIALSPSSISLAQAGETKTISATVLPGNATNKVLQWSSNNTSVATVSNGVVTAVGDGSATITAKSTDGSNITATCAVTVNGDVVSLSTINDAYIQGSTLFNNGDLRVESGNRVSYLMFDLSGLQGDIASAELVLGVGSDAGNGEITIHKGTSNNWTETTLSTSNAPAKGDLLGNLSGTYAVNNKYTFSLDASSISAGGSLSLVITHVSGNDVSFASKENSNASIRPVLKVTLEESAKLVENITVDPIAVTLEIGDQTTITPTIEPIDATNQDVVWESSNSAVATVSGGTIVAVSAGSATITCTAADGSNVSATCAVTVESGIINVESVSLNSNAETVNIGESLTLSETVLPADATNKNVTWSSSDNTVATVANGVVTAIAAGTADITVTTVDGNKTAICIVTVPNTGQDILTGHTIPAEIIYNGETTFTVSYETTEERDIHVDLQNTNTWAGQGNVVQTVNGTGTATFSFTPSNNPSLGDNYRFVIYITPKGATWRETIGDNMKQTVTLVANITNVESVSLDADTKTMDIGDSFTLTETVLPADADNKTVAWSSSDNAVATVVNGVVTAIAAGTADITVTTEDGSKTAICAVTVNSDEQTIPVGIQVDDVNKYLTTEYTVGESIEVTVSFNAGAGKTVSGDLGGIQVMLREITPSWGVAKDYIFADASVVGQQEGTITISVDLTGVPASADLTNGNFYFLFPRFVASDGTNYWVDGLAPINIVEDVTVGIEDITIEAEIFTSTGGTINDAVYGGPGLGAAKTETNINWVNSGDYTEYSVYVAADSEYLITYHISTPSDNAQIQISVDGTVASTDNVTNNGQWDDYYELPAGNSVYLTEGTHTIRIEATGSNAWQWNLDKVVLSEAAEVKRGDANSQIEDLAISFYPNPADDVLNIELSNSGSIAVAKIIGSNGDVVVSEQVQGSAQLFIGQLSTGIYILQVIDGNSVITEKIIKN